MIKMRDYLFIYDLSIIHTDNIRMPGLFDDDSITTIYYPNSHKFYINEYSVVFHPNGKRNISYNSNLFKQFILADNNILDKLLNYFRKDFKIDDEHKRLYNNAKKSGSDFL